MKNEPCLDIYYEEIGKTPLLKRSEEIELANKIRAGDGQSRDQMIRANLRLVVKIANQYANFGLPLADLIAEGNIGLMKAVDRYDPKFGTKFSTYSAHWIKQSIRRALSNQSRTVRLPTHMVARVHKVRVASLELEGKIGRRPDKSELGRVLELDEKQILTALEAGQRTASLDKEVAANGIAGTMLAHELLEDESAINPLTNLCESNLLSELDGLLDVLDERERDIISSRFGLDGCEVETLEQVGLRYGISRERIRQVQKAALKKLRFALRRRETHLPVVLQA